MSSVPNQTKAPVIKEFTDSTITVEGELGQNDLYALWKPVQDDFMEAHDIHFVMTSFCIDGETHIMLNVNSISLIASIVSIATGLPVSDTEAHRQPTKKVYKYTDKEVNHLLQLANTEYVSAIIDYINDKWQPVSYPVNLSYGYAEKKAKFTVATNPAAKTA